MENRIILEQFNNEKDYPYFAALAFNETVMNMNMGRVFTKEEAEEYYASIIEYNLANKNSGTYKVFLQKENTCIGICSLWVKSDLAEVEYMILPEYWGNGYATEIVGCLIEIAKQIPSVTKVSGLVSPENAPSKAVLVKNGFVFEKNLDVTENSSTVEILSLNLQ